MLIEIEREQPLKATMQLNLQTHRCGDKPLGANSLLMNEIHSLTLPSAEIYMS